MPKSIRKYPPLTAKKRFRGSRSPSSAARNHFNKLLDSCVSSANFIFTEMSCESRRFKLRDSENDMTIGSWKRLTASRIFFAYEADKEYVRSKVLPNKWKSLCAERHAVEEFAKCHPVLKLDVLMLHPVHFWAGCVPDAVVVEGGKLLLVEVKAVFWENEEWRNEMGDVYDPVSDHQDWLRQLQFSLWVSGVAEGELVVWEFETDKVANKIRISRDADFERDNLHLLQEFFLHEVFFHNVSVKSYKRSAKGRLTAALRHLLLQQTATNATDFQKKNRCSLETFGQRQIWGLIESRPT